MRARDYPFFQPRFIPMAHRGGWVDERDAPRENTLGAFRRAHDLGYTYMETDVHLTRDGVLVAFHDESLERLTGRPGTISDITLAELNGDRTDPSDRVPTMDELLEALPKARFNIDMKADSTVAPLWDVISAHACQDRVCVASFSARRLGRFRRLAGPGVATSTGQAEVVWHVVPLLPHYVQGAGVALQVPVARRVAGRMITVVTPRLVANAHARGLVVQVWTIDEADEMDRLITMGVDGLITNRIDVLRAVLERRGLWQALG